MGKDPMDLSSLLSTVQVLVNQLNSPSEGTPSLDETQIQELLSGALGLARAQLSPEQQQVVAKMLKSLLLKQGG
ncbi:MAG: hypothetical protein U1D96_09105 [Eubacteriales bacterium]|jgi:hypothetical protein|nr:hypothetical protein [Bacillota bacterium]MBV1726417.1 hypothetical protein [Desulforudis sp.]MDP3050022.1 hypothetical protein [Eubacteriales bacterium]MDQ7788684.1 hypothetical protein [Clostridia bacterium]MBU4532211.1 hypothetical protein [Bacillota bacterium]